MEADRNFIFRQLVPACKSSGADEFGGGAVRVVNIRGGRAHVRRRLALASQWPADPLLQHR